MKIVTVDPIPIRLISVDNISQHQMVFAICEGKVTYKLHVLSRSPHRYAFVSMEDSECWANGDHSTISEAIRTQIKYGDSVIVLDNLSELKEYL
jgi:hypothetical protein